MSFNRPPLQHIVLFFVLFSTAIADDAPVRRRLYVATPGIRNYLEYGGHGLLVFDIDDNHRFLKRIPTAGLDENGKPLNVKGICASAATNRLYISTIKTLQSFDLTSEKLIWERPYDKGCDRMAIAPDGKVLYVPSLEGDLWYVIDGATGDVVTRIEPKSGAHNTVYGLDGKHAYLAGLKSPFLTVTDTTSHTVQKAVGPFSASIRPFTVNGSQTRVYVNVNELLGFEIGDLTTGKMLARVEVTGFEVGPTKRHGCPSHGIALSLDEKEVWLADAHNSRVHIFDNTAMRDQPGWITFSIDGKLVYPSTGEVIDQASKRIIATLADEHGNPVHSEKLLEIDFKAGAPVRAGDQFGMGGVR